MPYSLSQLFSHGRGNCESRDKPGLKVLTRRRSTGTLLRQGSVEKQTADYSDPPPARKLSNIVPPSKKLAVTRQRSQTIHSLPVKSQKNNKHHYHKGTVKQPLVQEDSLPSPDCKHKHGFYDLAWSIVSARRLRNNSVTASPHKRKGVKSESPISSPLVTISNYRNLLQMSHLSVGRQNARNGEISSPNALDSNEISNDVCEAREDENLPASVENLVRKSAECFDENGNCSDGEFLRVFFLSHLWFMTSEQLMVLFSQLYEEEKDTENYAKKIFYAIRFWLHEFPHMFDLDHQLVNALEDLQKLSADDPNLDVSVIDLSNKESFKWMSEANMSVRPNQVSRKGRKVSLVFNHLEPEDIAIHMSYLEYKSFRRLTLTDLHNYVVHGVIKNNLKLERAVVLFNNITQWVQCMVLDHHKPQERAIAIVKFVEIAKKLHAMRNFNTLMAIVGALTHTAISRLKKTMAAVPKDTLKTLDEYIELLDSKSNYSSYRRAYGHVTEDFKIPIIGILMKDLISLHAALPDRIGNGLINVRKMMMIGGMFQELIRLQTTRFPYEINRDLLNTLRVSLYLYYNEDEVYKLSLVREPRDTKLSTSGTASSPTKKVNMGFAEFASFTCQLDEETIKQHVTAMVVSVYKAYDENSDGYISEAEFDHFKNNFPGLDSFSEVDKDQDGRISLEEMIEYFLKISSGRRHEICQCFKHEFVETTYFHPTFCEECKKLLWGLVKQGWKCKDCGINCHKHCKDRIVQECRHKSNTKNQNTTIPIASKRNKQRKKASVSSESDFSTNGDTLRLPGTDDDAFTTSNDLQPRRRPSNLGRPASFAAADMVSKAKRFGNGKDPSSTSSPTRKASTASLSYEAGKNTLQRKVQKMLKKKMSSKHLFSATTKQSKRDEKSIHSSLLKLVETPNSIETDLLTLDQSEATFELQDSHSQCCTPNELPESPVSADDSTTADQNTSSSSPQSKTYNAKLNYITDVQMITDRRDSGLSSCSYLTSTPISTSAPVTPSYQDISTGELQFQYPSMSSSSSSKISSGSRRNTLEICSKSNSLFDENERLRQENDELRKKLHHATELIQQLNNKLDSVNLSV